MGGAPTSSPYEFVQQGRSLKNSLEMKVRSVLAGRKSPG